MLPDDLKNMKHDSFAEDLQNILVLANMAYRLPPARNVIDGLEEGGAMRIARAFKEFQDVSIEVIDEDLKNRGMTKEDLLKGDSNGENGKAEGRETEHRESLRESDKGSGAGGFSGRGQSERPTDTDQSG